ncbi:MAG: hypothetical protein D6832_04555 [Alphaproteobacteria bacterium]|nr:MAG: hypothetical protein D6832_04555 [Alphaproteobacteria bacterium]
MADADLPEPDPARARRLGEVVAVADDSRPGLWLATSLVRAPAPGRVTWLDNGNALRLALVPAPPGSPARLSAEAMRALGIPLAARPRLIVWRE